PCHRPEQIKAPRRLQTGVLSDRNSLILRAMALRLGAFAGVMDQHLMLCYWNGDFWYDAHPIIAHKLQRARETSASGTSQE
ncbi:MAG: hypothetical protein AB1Z98_08520, partial [Nannocystaceae bacterium]